MELCGMNVKKLQIIYYMILQGELKTQDLEKLKKKKSLAISTLGT